MKERPILMSAPMVLAALDGRKTQTRRIVKPQPLSTNYLAPAWGTSPPPDPVDFGEKWLWREAGPDYPDDARDERRCPYGVPGDRLWVRETWAWSGDVNVDERVRIAHGDVWFRADLHRDNPAIAWRPSIHMPRWASRITLEITGLRVERLQEISEDDAQAEGVTTEPIDGRLNGKPAKLYAMTHRQAFVWLWDAINGKRAPWRSNPWVWVIAYRRIGWSDDAIRRLAHLSKVSGRKLELLATFPGGRHAERVFHNAFRDLRHDGEWFHFTGALARTVERLRRAAAT